MQTIWRRIERWLRDNAPQVLGTLNPGATMEQIEEIETALAVALPSDMKESYRIHNGQSVNPVDGSVFGLIDGCEVLSLESLVEVWAGWKQLLEQGTFKGIQSEPSGPVQPLWWSNLWVPVTDDGHGNNYCVDLNPAPGGSVGQIISVLHDDPHRTVLAPSFRHWLGGFANGLESGLYMFLEDYGGIMKKEDL
jgi:cell wall assembly regulator SMI1